MVNLTQYKLFIGDDKKNTISGVTFSFKHSGESKTPKLRHVEKNVTYFREGSKWDSFRGC